MLSEFEDSNVALNDVWRNISREIGVYWAGRFDRVPATPGVYGWFYPLRISSYDLNEFLVEASRVFEFDAQYSTRAPLRAHFAWEDIVLRVSKALAPTDFPPSARTAWSEIAADTTRFEEFRRALLKSSLLMPPLYVGKTNCLSIRCQQHIAGTGANNFHSRYESYARKRSLSAARISDLLFACIQLPGGGDGDQLDDSSSAMETVLEEVLKRVGRPPYSAR